MMLSKELLNEIDYFDVKVGDFKSKVKLHFQPRKINLFFFKIKIRRRRLKFKFDNYSPYDRARFNQFVKFLNKSLKEREEKLNEDEYFQ